VYTAVDPLLQFIGQNPNVGVLWSPLDDYSKEQAEQRTIRNQTIWTGGSKDEYRQFLQVTYYRYDHDVLVHWASPVNITGTTGQFWVPGVQSTDTLTVFITQVVRPVDFVKTDDITVQGIDCYKFEPIPAFADSETEYSPNSVYFQEIHGVFNVSTWIPTSAMITRGQMNNVPTSVSSGFTGITAGPYASEEWFAVEPMSGLGMKAHTVLQVNLQIPLLNAIFNIDPLIAPLGYQDNNQEINSTQANQFKEIVETITAGSIAAYVLGAVIGGALVMVGGFVFLKFREEQIGDQDPDIDMQNM